MKKVVYEKKACYLDPSTGHLYERSPADEKGAFVGIYVKKDPSLFSYTNPSLRKSEKKDEKKSMDK